MSSTALPSHATIWGEIHFPPVDNQGAIGSCASQSITRNQFTNAISRVIHRDNPASKFCPRDNFGDVFTPKYSYNIAGPGTAWVYEFISEHGALFQTEGIFKKNDAPDIDGKKVLGGSIPCDKNGKRFRQSASMLVNKGQMEKALRFRVTHFDQIWVTKEPYNERLTTCPEGQALLARIKEAVLRGDAVVTGGYPGRWVYAGIENVGTLGKEGERVCVAAAGNGGGGHQVTIVGYDDDVTAVFAGVRVKGAFQIVNSYGPLWQNKGLCWMSYDAVNTVSEFPALNDPGLYSGPMYFTPSDGFAMYPPALTDKNQTLTFKESGTYTLYGKIYPAYTAFDGESGRYVTYKPDKDDRGLYLSAEPGLRFSFIPYADLKSAPGVNKEYFKDEYKDSFWVYAADKECAPEGYCVLDAGVSFSASGRKTSFATVNALRYPEAKSWTLDNKPEGDFVSRLSITAGAGKKSERIWTLDQFCFIDWRKDVAVGMPTYYVKVSVLADDRDCFKVFLTRREKKTGARTEKYLPAMFRYVNSRPFYGKREKGGYMNFAGVYKGKARKAELCFSLLPLLNLPEGKSICDYAWGVELKKERHGNAALTEASLCDEKKRVLSHTSGNARKLNFRLTQKKT